MTVAPYVGAWIETSERCDVQYVSGSHPTWVRGLKQAEQAKNLQIQNVAPYVGAWIETWLSVETEICY